MASVSRRAMIAITTRSSINVNPERGRIASLAQRAAQLLLFRALHGELADGQRDRCEQRDDRHGDDELDKGETLDARSAASGHGMRFARALLLLHAAERHLRASRRRGPG